MGPGLRRGDVLGCDIGSCPCAGSLVSYRQASYKRKNPCTNAWFFFVLAKARIHATPTKPVTTSCVDIDVTSGHGTEIFCNAAPEKGDNHVNYQRNRG
jgi:hypothetical protein